MPQHLQKRELLWVLREMKNLDKEHAIGWTSSLWKNKYKKERERDGALALYACVRWPPSGLPDQLIFFFFPLAHLLMFFLFNWILRFFVINLHSKSLKNRNFLSLRCDLNNLLLRTIKTQPRGWKRNNNCSCWRQDFISRQSEVFQRCCQTTFLRLKNHEFFTFSPFNLMI